MKTKQILIAAISLPVLAYLGYGPIQEFYRLPKYKGNNEFSYTTPEQDFSKENIFLIADHDGTEIFDLMAPFYLFNLTDKANVFIVAEKKYPITIRKGFFILPHFTFEEVDALNIKPAAIVIPALSPMTREDQNPYLLEWIKSKHTATTKVLSICAGALTAASTGLYDGKPMTTHSSDFKRITKQVDAPAWIIDTAVTQSGSLYSTAGVSHAVEGSLQVIKDMYGEQTMNAVMQQINYPHQDVKLAHKSTAVTTGDKFTIIKKVYFRKNRKVGVLLQDGLDEFRLSAIIDTYHRSFPASIQTFSSDDQYIKSKFGLTIIPTGRLHDLKKMDEVHVLKQKSLSQSEVALLNNIVAYDNLSNEYIFNVSLKRIEQQYGKSFENVVRLLLDYD